MTVLASDRCDLRLKAEDKQLLLQAAHMNGTTLAGFIRNTALREAAKIVERERVLHLTLAESKAVLEALDKPFEPNPLLSEALALADELIANTQEFHANAGH